MSNAVNTLLEVKNLKKYFATKAGPLCAVDDVSFDVARGETLGLVGESGAANPPPAGPFCGSTSPLPAR